MRVALGASTVRAGIMVACGTLLLARCTLTWSGAPVADGDPAPSDAGRPDAAAHAPDAAGTTQDAGGAGAPDAAVTAVDAGAPDAGPPDAATTTHPPTLDFGYYRVDLVAAGGQSYASAVRAWTNLAYADWGTDARAFDVPEGGDMTPVRNNMAGILRRLTAEGLGVMMDVSWGIAWGPRLTKAGILQTAAPYWDSIRYLVLGDELTLTQAEADAAITEWRNALTALGLAARPIGVTLTPDAVLAGASVPGVLLADWDFIAMEAYTPACTCAACGNGTPADELAAVAASVAAQEARIPADKDLVMVLQGYDRNGAFRDITTLAALNRATYFDMVRGKPRYRAMVVFNWYREGSTCTANPYPTWGHGSSAYPSLQSAHQEIWRDLVGGP